MRKLQGFVITLFCISILTACSVPTETEAVNDSEKSAKDVFQTEDSIEANQQLDAFSLYLPASMEIVEKDATNVIIEDGDQTFIVFYNNQENASSQLNYQSAASKSDEALLLETFKDKDKFGYIRILPDEEENNYELQTGIGGVKITTFTSKSEMESDSKKMMKMARSIVLNKQSDSKSRQQDD